MIDKLQVRLGVLIEDQVFTRQYRRDGGYVRGLRELSLLKIFDGGGRRARRRVSVVQPHRGQRRYIPLAAEPGGGLRRRKIPLVALHRVAGGQRGTAFTELFKLAAPQKHLVGGEGGEYRHAALQREGPGAQRSARGIKQRDGEVLALKQAGRDLPVAVGVLRQPGPRRNDAGDAALDERPPVRLGDLFADRHAVTGGDKPSEI